MEVPATCVQVLCQEWGEEMTELLIVAGYLVISSILTGIGYGVTTPADRLCDVEQIWWVSWLWPIWIPMLFVAAGLAVVASPFFALGWLTYKAVDWLADNI